MRPWPALAAALVTVAGCASHRPAAPVRAAPRPAAMPTPAHGGAGAATAAADAESTESAESTDGPDLATLRSRLRSTLDPDHSAVLALPGAWPPTVPTLVFYIYRLEALPTGRVTERVEGPVAVARVDARTGAIEAEDIRTLPLVVQREALPDSRLAMRRRAEGRLLDVVVGRATADDVHGELRKDYCALLDDGALGGNLRARAPAFVEWLSCAPFASGGGRTRIETAP